MKKEERIANLKSKFEALNKAIETKEPSYSTLSRISESILIPMLKLDPLTAERMWEFMLVNYHSRCDSYTIYPLTDKVFQSDQIDVLRHIITNNLTIREIVMTLDPNGGHEYMAGYWSRILKKSNDFAYVTQEMNILLQNRHGENRPAQTRRDIIDTFMGDVLYWNDAEEGISFIKGLVRKVRDTEKRLEYELELDSIEENWREGQEPISIELEFNVTVEKQEITPAPTTDTSMIPNQSISARSLEDYLDELNRLIGLIVVKEEISNLVNLTKVQMLRKKRGMKVPEMSLHLVFSGNPGTGKTTVARLLGGIFHELGILSKGHLVEVDRSGLVAGYVGQTALKTGEVIKQALGGILFIDEAYSLATSESGEDFGQEAIDTLIKAMEDNRNDLVVIVAGYSELMPQLINSNPGLKSRFNKYIHFPDYSGEELFRILENLAQSNDYVITNSTQSALKEHFKKLYQNRSVGFGNARDVRNLFEKLVAKQANRIVQISAPTDIDIRTITIDDFEEATK